MDVGFWNIQPRFTVGDVVIVTSLTPGHESVGPIPHPRIKWRITAVLGPNGYTMELVSNPDETTMALDAQLDYAHSF